MSLLMPVLVERPLFRTGQSLAVTLPKAWIKHFHLKAGDQVEITPLGLYNDLVIMAKREAVEKKV